MSADQDQAKLLAFAVYELRLLLAGHLGSDGQTDVATRAAAHLAYALHNQALAVLEGRSFDMKAALDALAGLDTRFSENFVQRFIEASQR
jgi:hypothetical protein